MRIERIHLHHLRMPLKAPFETSFGRIETRDCILVTAYADGLVGYGECVADRDPGFAYETTQTAWHILQDYLAPSVLGQSVENSDDYQQRVVGVRGHPMAKAGIEMALWDLWGKQEETSLKQLLGSARSKVDVGVSVGLQASPQMLVEVAGNYLRKGYRRIKIKIKPGRDVGDVKAMRSAFPDLKLQVDANSAYTLESADMLRPLDEYGLLLIEQPLAEDDLWDHSRLAPKFKAPLCLDESITSLRVARQALEMQACQIVNIKQGRVGGISQGLAIHNLCQQEGVPVWCGGMLETGVGRAANLALASLPGFTLPGDISASERYYEEDITEEEFVLNEDSTIDVPDGLGLGIHINEAAVQKYKLQEVTLKT
jgi:O-succinylbenzoate synthase